jgi:ABC-type sugar transport system ATPase subunit
MDRLAKVSGRDGEKQTVRLGIRSFHIRVSKKCQSENAFQLPVYAIARTPEGTLVTFELNGSFLQVSLEGQADYDMSEMVWLDFDQDHLLFFEKTITVAND